MKHTSRYVFLTLTVLTSGLISSCGGNDGNPMPPVGPSPTPTPVIANAYILPDAVALGAFAFGDEPVVIYKGERLHWVNVDGIAHHIVADDPAATDFDTTGDLQPGGERSFDMIKIGMTTIHCADHPNMTGTLIVRER